MLYWLVGSRELDGGLMCTASHNPKAYTGAKLVKQGAIALSGDSGHRRDPRPRAGRRPRRHRARPAGPVEEVDIYDDFQEAALGVIDPSNVKPMKVVVDGGNGMAGPMVGPLLERLPIELVETYWTPDGELPRPRAQPAAAREPRSSSSTRCSRPGADLGIAWDGDGDRCFFIDDKGRFVDGDFLTGDPRRAPARQAAGVG